MGLRISTNNISLMAQHQISKSSRDLESALAQLASGSKFEGHRSDPASHAISENLNAQVKGLKAAERNADVADSFVQTAEGALNEQNNILIRLRELGVQSASDTVGDREREFLDLEFQQLKNEFDRIANSTRFGGADLLKGNGKTYEFQVGEHGTEADRITFENDSDTTASNIGIASLNVKDRSDSRDALEELDESLNKIANVRAKFGAAQSRLQTAKDFLGQQIVAVEDAKSKVGDTDVAEAVSRVRRGQILQQYQASVLAQANQLPEQALKLVG